MDLGIKGKTAMITACSSGLGQSIAQRLAMEGCNLTLLSRSAEKLESLARELRSKYGVEAFAIPGDMTREQDMEHFTQVTQEKLGGPDILILNTGRPPLKMTTVLGETDAQRWEQAYQTQLLAATIAVRVIVPKMIGRGWGRIVGVTSASVARPMTNHALSTVYRAGVTALLKHLANEIAQHQITVNTVQPSSIRTTSLASSYDMSERIKRIPLGRLGTPEEFAATVAYLVSEPAGFITGTHLLIDGGMAGSLQ
jgi:3-oxoacyl-[acyl-carrier protein] reductase